MCLSRLVYRKGIDLLAHVIPQICRLVPNADFIIGASAACSNAGSCCICA